MGDGLAGDGWTFDGGGVRGLAAGKKIGLAGRADRPGEEQAGEEPEAHACPTDRSLHTGQYRRLLAGDAVVVTVEPVHVGADHLEVVCTGAAAVEVGRGDRYARSP